MKRSTIYDVAREAGVSHQTVSRYLAGFEGIRPATREKVERALHALDYRPNVAARSLRTRRIDRIGVLVHALGRSGPSRVLAGASIAAGDHGYVLDIVNMDGDDPRSVDAALSLATSRQLAGLIATANTESVLEVIRARQLDLPIAAEITNTPPGFDMPHDEAIGALSARHLTELGHRRVGYVAGPAGWAAAVGRRTGFCQAIEEAGGTVTVVHADWGADDGFAAADRLVTAVPDLTAIATANDSTAIGAIAALHRRGLAVPRDVSVIGVDDIPEARHLITPLSTVAIDFEGEGRRLIEDVLVRGGALDPAEVGSLRAPTLVPRETTARIGA